MDDVLLRVPFSPRMPSAVEVGALDDENDIVHSLPGSDETTLHGQACDEKERSRGTRSDPALAADRFPS